VTLNNFVGGAPTPGQGQLTLGTSGCGGAQTDTWTLRGRVDCAPLIAFDNGKIFSQGGAEILGAIGFGANTLRAICPDTSGPGDFVCGIEL
jgi:hypothetical protein